MLALGGDEAARLERNVWRNMRAMSAANKTTTDFRTGRETRKS